MGPSSTIWRRSRTVLRSAPRAALGPCAMTEKLRPWEMKTAGCSEAAGQVQGAPLHGDAEQPGVRTLRVHELPVAVCPSRRWPTPTAQLPGPPPGQISLPLTPAKDATPGDSSRPAATRGSGPSCSPGSSVKACICRERPMERLRQILAAIDRQSYKAYKRLEGTYTFAGFILNVDHVQGDPFADPSRMSVRVPMERAGYPARLLQTAVRRVALEDYLGRAVRDAIRRCVRGHRGTGHSGEMGIATSGQQVLRRNAVVLGDDHVEARITLGLPAAGRRILAREAEAMLVRELPEVVAGGLLHARLEAAAVEAHVLSVEDQAFLRGWLSSQGLVAFVADGAILPRRSGIDDRPLESGALPFRSPDSLARVAPLPSAGPIRGLGIPEGVTLIVGGGFHGKSTLLHALERGVYDHVPGDGRERVATLPTAMKVRAEDGRAVSCVDISPFIDRLPLGRDTHRFTTENASGSTSQAAGIVEAIETGTRLLLIDEDTSATNFMIRDRRMQALVTRDKEPITPFLHRVRELFRDQGTSSVLVMGGSGDYFEVADTVIMMDTYEPLDVTADAHHLAGNDVGEALVAGLPPISPASGRRPKSLDASRGRREVKVAAKGRERLIYGERAVDLSKVEQLVDAGQTRAIGWLILRYAQHHAAGSRNLVEGLQAALREAETQGLDILLPWKVGNLAMPRLLELAAALNRMRGLTWG
jgi:predicted ABC-class ATPase